VYGLADTSAPVHVLVEKAGRGKTNLLCDVALRSATLRPTIFLAARSLGQDATAIDAAVADILEALPEPRMSSLAELSMRVGRHQNILVCIDGINENPDPTVFARTLKAFTANIERDNIRVIVTCRDEYWPLFKRCLVDEAGAVSHGMLGLFGEKQFSAALGRYMHHFRITGKIDGAARRALHDPLLLRFFCEAFSGRQIDVPLMEIRLLQLFEIYTQRKIHELAVKFPAEAATYAITDQIEMIAEMMASSSSATVWRKQVAAALPYGETTRLGSPYRMILDEDIIIEETLSNFDLRVTFVYEAFLEYVLSRIVRRVQVNRSAYLAFMEWWNSHRQFPNRIGVLGFFLAYLFNESRGDFRELANWVGAAGREALAGLAIALENIDPRLLAVEDIRLILLVLTGAEGSASQRLAATAFPVLARSSRPCEADIPMVAGEYYEGLRLKCHAHFVKLLESIDECHPDFLLVALNERLSMSDPLENLKEDTVKRYRRFFEDRNTEWTVQRHGLLGSIASLWVSYRDKRYFENGSWPDRRVARFALLLNGLSTRRLSQCSPLNYRQALNGVLDISNG
jgi:hypothetical protein